MVEKKKKMKINVGSANEENSAGFVGIENFDGIVGDFSTDMLKDFKDTVEFAVKHKLERVRIGIAKNGAVLVFFFDKENKFGYVIVGLAKEGEEKKGEREK